MFNRSFLYLVIVSTLIFSGCIIEGRIVGENGVGVAGVTIVLSGDDSRTTTTNQGGFYKFGVLLNHDRIRAGYYTVTPSHPRYDFAPADRDITIANKTLGRFFWTRTVPWPAIGVDFEANDDRFISIRRDEMGIVHIYAATDENAYYGAGYMQAYDRLFQMDLMRRRALGRRAEVLGNSAVSDDILMRHINISALGQQNVEVITEEYPEYKSLLEAWVEGVNVRIDEVLLGEADLPYGFGIDELDYLPEYWTVEDALAVGKLILCGNANQIEYDILATVLQKYFPEVADLPLFMPLRDTYILPDAPTTFNTLPEANTSYCSFKSLPADAEERFKRFSENMALHFSGASNNWAIDGQHTFNGRPLLANDPHQPLNSPSLMWGHHMNSADQGGNLDVIGFGFVGVPSVQLGHNRHLAWAATTNFPDMMDLWDVEVSAEQVKIGDEWIPAETRTETVRVRGEEDRIFDVMTVPGYGVVLPDDVAPIPLVFFNHRILLNWTGFGPTHEAVGFHGFDVSESLDDFEYYVDLMEIAAFNFVGATTDGISYRSSPLVPDRGTPSDDQPHYRMLDGGDPGTIWTGNYLQSFQLPRSRGGDRGWIVTANNDPFGFTSDGLLDGDPYYYGVYFDPGTRASRIESELTQMINAGPVTIEQMQTLQDDTYTLMADDLIPLLESAYAALYTDEALAEYRYRDEFDGLVEQMTLWDRHMERDSSAAVVFNAFCFFATREAVGDDFGILFETVLSYQPVYMIKFAIQVLTDRISNATEYLPDGKDLTLLRALDKTVEYLNAQFGGVDPTGYIWGEIHGTRFDHVWADGEGVGWVATDGAEGTVNVSSSSFFRYGVPLARLDSTSGAIHRMVTSFDEDGMPVSQVNYPPGNGGDSFSPYFENTLDDWVENQHRQLLFDDEDIQENTVESLELRRDITEQ